MPDLSDRLAGLPAAKRQLLDRLVQQGRAPGTGQAPAAAGGEHDTALASRAAAIAQARAAAQQRPGAPAGLSLAFGASPDEVKQGYQRFYDQVSAQLDATVFGEFSFFLNYGYVANLSPQLSRVKLPDHALNKNSVRLVLELIGDCPLDGRRVLDVGCGRGGTVHVIQTFFAPAEVTGLDLSAAAIAFCRRVHRHPGVRFECGDAEHLPFPDGSFDVITNVESSHTYPNIARFYAEAHRTLGPGGHFLYTDVHSAEDWARNVGLLEARGFVVEQERDITANVLLSCDEVAQSRVQAFDSGNDPGLMRNFLATPGSDVYAEMYQGRWKYKLLKLRR
jgi:phthiocerol/phenolphthiocerol synthesis type-I polyketide synthase E